MFHTFLLKVLAVVLVLISIQFRSVAAKPVLTNNDSYDNEVNVKGEKKNREKFDPSKI